MFPPKLVHVSIAILLSLAFAGGQSAGQSIVTFQNQIVARTGDAVPGVPGAAFGAALGWDHPVLQDDGRVFFQSQIQGGGAVANVTDRALFYGDKGALSKVLRWGDAEPTGTIPGATVTQIFPHYAMSATGSMVFGARVAGPGITFSNDSVLYAGTPGSFQLVAREGEQAAGCPAGTIHAVNSTNFGLNFYEMTSNAAGNIAFTNTLSGTLTGRGVFAGPPGALVKIMSANEVVGTNLTVVGVPQFVQINASGQVLLEPVGYQSVTINNQPIVHAGNNASAWIYTPGAGKQEILREGNASPIAGAQYADPVSSGGGQRPTFNASGQVFMSCGLVNIGSSTAVTFGVNDRVLLLASAGGHTLVARKGDSAPGIPGATLQLSSSVEMLLNDDGVVSFCSQIAGPGVTAANDTALWIGTPGNLTLVAREGSVAPGTGGLAFGDMCGVKLLNGASQLIFHNFLVGVPTTFALWCWDPAAGLQIVSKTGDTIEVSPGNFQAFGVGNLHLQSNGDARPAAFGHDGTLVSAAGIGLSGGIVKIRIGSLTGLPKTISAAAGGVHSLFLNAAAAHAGEAYLVAGSVSGTSPGIQVGSFLVPLNLDFYTSMILTSPNVPPFGNTLGVLDGFGQAVATITIPPGIPGISGLVLNHVYATVDGSNNLVFVSEPASFTILP